MAKNGGTYANKFVESSHKLNFESANKAINQKK